MAKLIAPALMREIRGQFRLDWTGIHGAAHWARVRYHGVWLARQLGADVRIPSIFAVLHDSQRQNDGHDPQHGPRAAEYAAWARKRGLFELDDAAFELLKIACIGHSDGHTQAYVSVQVCWDADRLDLGRVGIYPDSRRLCTSPAKHAGVIERAWHWSTR